MDTSRDAPHPPAPTGANPAGGGSTTHPWRAFLVLAVAIFLTILDLFVVNVALPAIAADFADASLSSLSWVLTGYAIVFAAVLAPAGKLGDLYGRRRFFLIGMLLFVAGSALAATAASLPLLIAARAVQAIGAAAVTPNSLALALTLFPARRRAGVIAAWGAIAGLGAAAGPVAGALLAEADWRWIFLINLPIGVVALVLVPRLIGEVRDDAPAPVPDGLGAVVLAVAVGLLVLGLSQTPEWGWDARVMACLGSAGALTVIFLWRSARHPAPIVELSMLRVPSFAGAMVATVFLWAGFAALLVGSALFLTGPWRLSVLEAGFALAPGPAVSALFAASSGRLGARYGPVRVGMAGGSLFAIGGLLLAILLTTEIEYITAFLPAQILIGAGAGLTIPTLVAIALTELPPTRFSTGTAVYATFRQIGTALGVAVWVGATRGLSTESASSFVPGWVFIASAGFATTLALATVRNRTIRTPVEGPARLFDGARRWGRRVAARLRDRVATTANQFSGGTG